MSHLSFVEVNTGTEQVATVDTNKRTPILIIPRNVLEEQCEGSWDRLSVINIDVVDPSGAKTRFFLDLTITKIGRATLTVATKINDENTTVGIKTKLEKVTGEWR